MKISSTSARNRRGFTLIEVIAVLVLLGILAAVAVPRYIDLTAAAEQRALDAGIAELNGRESLAWANEMLLTSGGPVSDSAIHAAVIAGGLGSDYTLTSAWVTEGGTTGTLVFGGATYNLTRTEADATSPARWTGTLAP